MSSELTDLLNTTDRKIKTGNFLIKDNYLQFQNMTIQMRKIAKLNVSIKKFHIPKGTMIFSILSLLFLFLYLPIGLVGVVLCVVYWFLLYSDYQNSNNYLSIRMNSGEIYILYIRDKEFLLTIRQVIESSFTNKRNNIFINIEEQKIYNDINYILDNENAHVDLKIQKGMCIQSKNTHRLN